MLPLLDQDVLDRTFTELELPEVVLLSAVCAELNQSVRFQRSLVVPRSGAEKITLAALLRFQALEQLSLHGFQVDDEMARQLLAGLPKVQHLTVIGANVSGLEVFQRADGAPSSNLQHLALPWTPSLYRDASPGLAEWRELRSLDISRSLVSDQQLEAVWSRTPCLKALVARDCRNLQAFGLSIGSRGERLEACLSEIDFSGTPIVDRAVSYLGRLPALRVLVLARCQRLQAPVLEHEGLLRLSFTKCVSLTRPTVGAPRLEDLSLQQTTVGDDVAKDILARCWQSLLKLDLRESALELSDCMPAAGLRLKSLAVSRSGVSLVFVERLLSSASASLASLEAAAVQAGGVFRLVPPGACGLRNVVLDQAAVTDEALQAVVGLCPSLESLSLRYCPEIHCPPQSETLAFLEVSGSGFDDEGVAGIAAACPNLRTLLARDCEQLRKCRFGGLQLRFACLCRSAQLETLEVSPAPRLTALDLGNCLRLGELEISTCRAMREVNLYASGDAVACDTAGAPGWATGEWHLGEGVSRLRSELLSRGVVVSTRASRYISNKATTYEEELAG